MPQQILGKGHHACGATHGLMERCDFACTSCYLTADANAVPPLDSEAVFRQLDALRAFLGPQGKAQLTSGEVTLLDRDVLGGYVRYAKHIGLDPMVMTNGRRLLDEPAYFEALVRDHGLEKISIHIDVTQRGRRGWHADQREEELHALRTRFASLIRKTRAATGRTLHAAQTVTVTARNLEAIPSIMRWAREHADAFRMISFQPAAEVGRTQDRRLEGISLDEVWQRICDGLGHELNRHAMVFGHPACHIIAPLVLVNAGDPLLVLETARAGKRWDRTFLERLMNAIGGYTVRGKSRVANLIGIVSLLARQPRLLAESLFYGPYRLWGVRRWIPRVLVALVRGRLRIQPLAVIVHKFMSPDELETPLGRERLAACTFQLPVDGRIVPMCQMNGTSLRAQANDRARELVTIGE